MSNFTYILGGIPATLEVSAGSWLLAAALGVAWTMAVRARFAPARQAADALAMVTRGIPQLVALVILFFGFHRYLNLSPYETAVLGLGLVETPFVVEVYRSALATVEKTQVEAAMSLGMHRGPAFARVVVPQSARFAIAPMLNIFNALTKFSALTFTVGVNEIAGRANLVITGSSAQSVFMTATLAMCAAYLIILIPLDIITRIVEVRLRRRTAGHPAAQGQAGLPGLSRTLRLTSTR